MAGSGRSSSHTGAPTQDSRDERKCVALIGTNSFGGEFGKVIEQYFYSSGWAIMGESGISTVNPGGSMKNQPTKGWRWINTNMTLQDLITKRGPRSAAIKANLKKFKPEAIVIQFDSIMNGADLDKTPGQLQAILLNTVKSIKSIVKGGPHIYFIGTPNINDLNVEAQAKVAGKNGVKFMGKIGQRLNDIPIYSRNQAWMAAGFGTTGNGRHKVGMGAWGKNVFVCDPLIWRFPNFAYAAATLDEKINLRKLGMYTINKWLKKYVNQVKSPGPPKRKARIPESPYISGLLNALTPDLTDPNAAKQYLLQIAKRLGYDLSPNPSANNANPHWKALVKRSFLMSTGTLTIGNGPFHDDELSKIFGFKKKKLSQADQQSLGYTPAPNTTPTNANEFPKKSIADDLRTQISEQVHKAARLYEKQTKEAEKTIGQKKQEQAQGVTPPPCPPGFMGTDTVVPVPAGSTYKGPNTVKRNKLDAAVRPGPSPIKVVLNPWTFKHWKNYEGDKWKIGLKAFDAVSVKVMDGGREFASKLSLEVLQICEGMGVYAQGWGYHYMRDIASATREAKKAAAVVKKLKLRAYYCNAEKEWAGVWKEPITPDPSGAAMQFAYIFKKECPGIPLLWNGLTRKTLTYTNGKKRDIFSDAALAFYDGYAPMRYATKISTQVSSTRKGGVRAQEVKIPYCPMWHIGPKWSKGKVWGYANDSKGKPGIFTFCRNQGSDLKLWPKITWATFYYGSTKGPSGTLGDEKNPSLMAIAQGIRSGVQNMPNGTGKGFSEKSGCKNVHTNGHCLDGDPKKESTKPAKPSTNLEKKAKTLVDGQNPTPKTSTVPKPPADGTSGT